MIKRTSKALRATDMLLLCVALIAICAVAFMGLDGVPPFVAISMTLIVIFLAALRYVLWEKHIATEVVPKRLLYISKTLYFLAIVFFLLEVIFNDLATLFGGLSLASICGYWHFVDKIEGGDSASKSQDIF